MFSKKVITFVAVASALVLLLSIALPTIGSNRGASSTPASVNDTTATSSLNNTNNTAMPSESDWENLTTFELFELYPALENFTSNDTDTAANETETAQQLPSPESNQQTNDTLQQNETRSTATANATLLDQLQSTVNSINQSITELRSDSNTTGEENIALTFTREITGDLDKDDYIILADLAPYKTTKGQAQVELKVPCNNDEEPKVKLVVGSIPRLKELNLGKAIEKANVKGSDNDIKLSEGGEYCLYDAKLPGGISDIILINDSGKKLRFSEEGRYYVAMTIGLSPKE